MTRKEILETIRDGGPGGFYGLLRRRKELRDPRLREAFDKAWDVFVTGMAETERYLEKTEHKPGTCSCHPGAKRPRRAARRPADPFQEDAF